MITKLEPPPITDYPSFKAQPDYPSTSKSYRNEAVFSRTDSTNSSILISLSLQRAFLMNGDDIALDYVEHVMKYRETYRHLSHGADRLGRISELLQDIIVKLV